MPEFKFVELRHIDKTMVQVAWLKIDDNGKEEIIGDQNLMSPEDWEDYQEKVKRTKVKCEG